MCAKQANQYSVEIIIYIIIQNPNLNHWWWDDEDDDGDGDETGVDRSVNKIDHFSQLSMKMMLTWFRQS